MRITAGAVVILGALCAVAGCDKGKSTTESSTSTQPAQSGGGTNAAAYFKMKCVVCHGEHGQGDGPGSAALNPKPRNFTDAAWQDSVKDDELKKAITEGGASVGKSAAMAPNPDLKSKPELLDALVKYVRGLKK
jgi:mono/diheme cytochrome c family protein